MVGIIYNLQQYVFVFAIIRRFNGELCESCFQRSTLPFIKTACGKCGAVSTKIQKNNCYSTKKITQFTVYENARTDLRTQIRLNEQFSVQSV